MGKLHRINMDVDTSQLALQLLYKTPDARQLVAFKERLKEWKLKPENKRGEKPSQRASIMDGSEFFIDTVMKSINMTQPTGNVDVLKKTKDIFNKMRAARSASDEKLDLTKDEYAFVREAIEKADGWSNHHDVAAAVLVVDEAVCMFDYVDEPKKKAKKKK